MATKMPGSIAIGDSRWSTTPDYSVFISFAAIAIWSSVPLTIRLLVTLKRKRGLYFWSILVCGWGLSLRQLGYVLKFMVPRCPYILGDILAQGGWVAMVTGFSMVLYSRLNLILENTTIRRRVLWMIMVNGIIFHPLMITISIAMNVIRKGDGKGDLNKWQSVNVPSERIQIIVFSGQETIISLFYVRAAYQYLKGRFADKEKTRRAMFLLLAVQVFIVAIDIVLIAIDFAGYLQLKLFIHSFVYAVKLELEFVVLNQLIEISQLGIPGFSSFTTALGSKKSDSGSPSSPAAIILNWNAPVSPGSAFLTDESSMSSSIKPRLTHHESSSIEGSLGEEEFITPSIKPGFVHKICPVLEKIPLGNPSKSAVIGIVTEV